MTRDSRAEEISVALTRVRQRIETACRASGRDPDSITTIVVTKTRPAEDCRRLAELGVRDLGENRDQEAAAKAAACSDEPIVWHFIGQLQRNKASSVTRYASYVHSVDRESLAGALGRAADSHDRRIGCFVQVSLDRDAGAQGRGGCAPGDVDRLCEAVRVQPALDLVGLMAVAPLGEDAGTAFDRLAQLHRSVVTRFPEAAWLSAGMSHDLEEAVAAGATHVRVGSAVLGERAHVR